MKNGSDGTKVKSLRGIEQRLKVHTAKTLANFKFFLKVDEQTSPIRQKFDRFKLKNCVDPLTNESR